MRWTLPYIDQGNHGLTMLMLASILGDLETAKSLLERGADVNIQHPFSLNTPLHFCAEMGHVNLIRTFCDHGADPELKKKNGGTPLHTAAGRRKPLSCTIECDLESD